MTKELVDHIYLHCKELVTLAVGAPRGARRGKDLGEIGLVRDGALAVRQGRIVASGTTDEVMRRFTAHATTDLDSYVVVPGFVDCHTHPVFVGTREDEFHQRHAGADYLAIAQQGGGILKTVRALRAASLSELTAATRDHLDGFLQHGTTTIEAKTGYGLSTAAEEKSLDALDAARKEHPLRISSTFLGAHEFPPEFREDREAYVRLLIEEMLPRVKGRVDSCDVFAEPKVFDRTQSLRILSAARAEGLRLRVHADEIEPMGGAGLAVDLGADSADHLQRISLDDQDRLARSPTTAVLLPGPSFLLGKPGHAPARSLLDKGAAVALATDFNPGTCYTQSLPAILTLACVNLKMRPEECLWAATQNAAASLHLDGDVGSLHPGKRCDLAVLELPSYRALGYAYGGNPVVMTVMDGETVWVNTAERA